MKFVDTAKISVSAGKGGDGHLSFRRTRGNAKGGPDGGDGGDGGDIVLMADHNSSTLSKYRTNRVWSAQAGQEGGKNRRHGKRGDDVVLIVPPGTIVMADNCPIADLSRHGQKQIIARGGRGGFGNAHFTSSTRQAPRIAELGEVGEEFELILELKLVADVGLIGLPNAGKSTLLSVISAARPQVADYPFTTLVPNLGVVDVDQASFLVADIPGLIKGAALGKGLGDEFLRHVERTKLLLHLVDATSQDIIKDYHVIRTELASYRVDLSTYPSIVVLNKIDAISPKQLKGKLDQLKKVVPRSTRIMTISAVTKKNLIELLRLSAKKLKTLTVTDQTLDEKDKLPVIVLDETDRAWQVERIDDYYQVRGVHLERIAARTNLAQPQAVLRLRDVLKKEGVLREIKRQGGMAGDLIKIGKRQLDL